MIIYEVCWQDCDQGLCVKWASSKTGAAKAKAKVRAWYKKQKAENKGLREGYSNFDQFYDTVKHDIPSGKQGLIDWLNINLTNNNG